MHSKCLTSGAFFSRVWPLYGIGISRARDWIQAAVADLRCCSCGNTCFNPLPGWGLNPHAGAAETLLIPLHHSRNSKWSFLTLSNILGYCCSDGRLWML